MSVYAIGPMIMMKFVCLLTKGTGDSHDRQLEPDHGRRHRNVRCLPCDRRRQGEVRLRRRTGVRRTCSKLRRGNEASADLQDRRRTCNAETCRRAIPITAAAATASATKSDMMMEEIDMDVLKRSSCQRAGSEGACNQLRGGMSTDIMKRRQWQRLSRCINCKNAQCVKGCPVAIQIPQFIEQVKNGNIEEAYRIISESSALPGCLRPCMPAGEPV